MLELKNIVKDYETGDSVVHALKNVNLRFRQSEFVAILGPSGCGKTTLLNIIGGLDQYTSGDLVIGGRSTRDFSARDWDTYRNHSIGFVFQSYNLIPHQTVLQNVELALTLSGVSKFERRRRAVQALEKVGLGDQLRKKPNQMSGGQMQRVAIARALVNDPDILLADEPTGALDSETSIQIMELLKQISGEKLIIMVTHNPDLAARYASRTVRLLDGELLSDSDPCEQSVPVLPAQPKDKRTSMSFFTALWLSFNNLLTKKARTILMAFAGSIGIIGIALILSLSNGIQTYIDDVQEDTLSSYPISIEAESVDMTSMVTTLMGARRDALTQEHDESRVYASSVMYDLMDGMVNAETQTNDLTAFRRYLDDPDSDIHQYLSAVRYSYDLELPIYTLDAEENIIKSDVMQLLQNMMSSMYGGDYSSYFSQFGSYYSAINVWEELLADEDGGLISPLVSSQYDMLYGRWPEAYDEVILVVSENNEISDLVMYAMGLRTEQEMSEAMQAAMNGESLEKKEDNWSFEELCGRTFQLILPCESYSYDAVSGHYTDLTATQAGMDYLYHSDEVGTTLKIVGIVRPDPDAAASMVSGSIGYTSALTQHVLQKTASSDIVLQQLDEPETDVFLGLPFRTGNEPEPTVAQQREAVQAQLDAADELTRAQMYSALSQQPSQAYLDAVTEQTMASMTRESIEQQMTQSYADEMGADPETVRTYIAQMEDETLFAYVEKMVRESAAEQYAQSAAQELSALSTAQLAAAMEQTELNDEQLRYLYDTYVPDAYSDSTLEDNLTALGYVDEDKPARVSLYAATFSDKDAVADCIERYNEGLSEEEQLTYTDYVALLMSSITTIIDAISYVLIAFVSISLVVSSIMIGIITYISVLERTKEIGILRAIGASKRDISRVFNAETLIEGLAAGAFGIGLTLLLIIPINAIVRHLTGIGSLGASLPWKAAVALVCISMLLTFLAGLIPSSIAAKKDPVVALRTE